MYVDLLSTIIKYPDYPLYRVAAIAGLNLDQNPEIIHDLTSHDLVRLIGKHRYAATQRGYEWRKQFLNLESMIIDELVTMEANH